MICLWPGTERRSDVLAVSNAKTSEPRPVFLTNVESLEKAGRLPV